MEGKLQHREFVNTAQLIHVSGQLLIERLQLACALTKSQPIEYSYSYTT